MEIDITHLEVGQIKPRWLEQRADVDIIVPPEARVAQPSSVLHLRGPLDGSSYETLVVAAQSEVADGRQALVIDLEGVPSLSSAGAIGLYMVGALLEGVDLRDLEGYGVMGQMRKAIEDGTPLAGLCAAAPNESVGRALEGMGMLRICPVFPSVNDALSDMP